MTRSSKWKQEEEVADFRTSQDLSILKIYSSEFTEHILTDDLI